MATVEVIGCYELLCRTAARHGWKVRIARHDTFERLLVTGIGFEFEIAGFPTVDLDDAAAQLLESLDQAGVLR